MRYFKIKWRGPCKKKHVLEVAVIVALQLTEGDIVGIHYEQMDVLEDALVDRDKPLFSERYLNHICYRIRRSGFCKAVKSSGVMDLPLIWQPLGQFADG